jgi:hypothetical protein
MNRLGPSFLLALVMAMPRLAHAMPEGVYGADDRHDAYEIADPAVRALADSTVALMDRSVLRLDSSRRFYVPAHDLVSLRKSDIQACEDVPFAGQPTLASCSGALVGEDLVLTASHCVPPVSDCGDVQVVFGYAAQAPDQVTTRFAAGEVYSCKEVLAYGYSDHDDFAVFRLDRKVAGHRPLKISRSGRVAAGTPVLMAGYPSGLPLKVVDHAHVRGRGDRTEAFAADLDTFPANSGSPVFNARTHLIEGVLARGEGDYVYENDDDPCTRPERVRCDARHPCKGARATYVSYAAKYIPE